MCFNTARYSVVRGVTVGALGASLEFLGLTSFAASQTYPISFVGAPDWQTVARKYPVGPVAQLVPNTNLGGPLILIRLIAKSEPLTAAGAARTAYDELFVTNGARSPSRGAFVAIVVYGQPDSHGSIAEFGFLFHRDSNNGWGPRPVAKPDVEAVLAALQRSPESSNSAAATASYPILFNKAPDYRGAVSALPPNMPSAWLVKSRVLDHAVILIQIGTEEALSDTDIARSAYSAVFKNEGRLPRGAVYVVVNIYGPPTSGQSGSSILVFPKTGYIFSRDATGRWKPRLVSQKELDAIAKLVLPPRISQ